MMTGLTIQPMRRRHVKRVQPIERAVHVKPWSPGVFQSEIDLVAKGERYYVVLVGEGELLGYAGLMFVSDEAHITNIAIDPAFQRRGLARLLLVHLATEAIERGCQALTLEVRVSNTAAQGLYREFGFAPAGVRQRYYENTEDALVMWAHDVQGAEYRERLARIADRIEAGGGSWQRADA